MQRSARSLSVLAVALATIAGGDAGALAAAPWSEPQSINGSFERLLFNANGQGMLIGLGQVLPGDGRRGKVRAATVQGGTPGQTQESTTPLDLGLTKVYGRDGVVAGGHVKPGVSPHVALTRGRLGHRLSRPQPLRGRSRSSHLLDLAVNGVGNAVAVVRWCQTQGCGRQTLEIFRWRPGARLSRPLRIARGRRLGAGVAINTRGDVAIVWDRFSRRGRRDVFGQILTASGKLRPRQRVGTAPAGPRYRIALTDDRRVVAAWVAQNISECDAHAGEIAVAQASKGGRFGRARRLTTLAITGCGRYASDPAVQFARAPGGRVLIAWSGNEGARWVVRAGELGAAGVESVAVVSDRGSDAVLADLALGSRGEAVLLLADGVGGSDPTGPNRLLAVTRGWDRGSFTAPELVADRAGIGSSVTFDPLTSRATVAYPATDAQFMPITSVVMRDWFGP
ncbi:MAG: hypothetical protein M3550_05475 [Actinomycetota bacterium]|nr:hypothetical protein [Actinomycetota bacterium]